MTRDEARERFSRAVDGELSEEERKDFEASLAADPDLGVEYQRFRETVRGTRALGSVRPPRVDLVAGVQRKLRTRSRGRYYRDRFATYPGRRWAPLTMTILALVLLGVAWLMTGWLLP